MMRSCFTKIYYNAMIIVLKNSNTMQFMMNNSVDQSVEIIGKSNL